MRVYKKTAKPNWIEKRSKEQKITGTNDNMCVCVCKVDFDHLLNHYKSFLHSFFFGFWFLKFADLAIFERVNVAATVVVALLVILVVAAAAATFAQHKKNVWNENISNWIEFCLSVSFFMLSADIWWPIAVRVCVRFQVDNK